MNWDTAEVFSSLPVSRWTSTSPCPCCSAWRRIWSTMSCWIRRRAVRTLLSRCVWSQPSPSPHTPPQCTGRPSPSTLSWERPTNWTAWKNSATVPSVNRSVLRVKRSTVTYEESYPLAFIFTSVEVVKLEQGTPQFFFSVMVKLNFQHPLLQSSISHDPSAVILIYCFGDETVLLLNSFCIESSI